MHVFAKIGFVLPHKASSQSDIGTRIEKTDLRKGDLVFFKTLGSSVINHVGIYIGDGNFIHSSSGSGYVRINSLSSGYYLNCYQSARRLVNITG
jgi:cell wall-associated NlpC family hydrolase